MYGAMKDELTALAASLRGQGLYKEERVLLGPQGGVIHARGIDGITREVINFCANNYLGLSNHPEIIRAARQAMDRYGFGYSSVRFICGTSELHKELEEEMSSFLGTEDTILYAAAFDANGGVFEPLLGEQDAIISDELNHASIIDGVRLCRARRYRYAHADTGDLETQLRKARSEGCRFCLIVTDGVFSMDGDIAPLPEIVELARRYDALVMVDDCHATGYLGKSGRGTAEYFGLEGEIDIITTTFGKALGGASGGCVSGHREIIEILRQRSRPYLFSNTLAPAIAGATLRAVRMVGENPQWCQRPLELARRFRTALTGAGLDLLPGETAIVPVMMYDEGRALALAEKLFEEGIYVIGFAHPVVPRGRARIRVQLSAAHREEQVDQASRAFIEMARKMKLV
ncbi:2-amino-3-ketobutyrate coenzyme A ligase [Alkalispirochaeta americana]|uniref:2-amino-3-ketobutyrate coenzyme A ligase n=1 Tax=Alkalispirochaeta americana TaxID=159291 RepID=A0A1N6WYQ6_9SPIO|nr:glycine C-acetyltransferase [Alkalispirochaeta americana]SIQ95193.1 2-amino-3-ketobutyrate coenzyme A ligase [Alkalispirochaeta americana]